ncbi:N-acetyltransferase [Mesorhizobium sp. CAU 1732]|uniref:GNAT family N-acetyltransferase n=1 Tax=Mesorhizobium sp. CAU 1732 TaxID=3140358 RepID=UPI003260DC84
MIRNLVIRPAEEADRAAIHALVDAAFEGPSEAKLVDRLVADNDVVLELVALHEGTLVGHVLFSRLLVKTGNRLVPAVALAPLAVDPGSQRTGVGTALVENAHHMVQEAGETLSVVLGDPAYYGRFGYVHDRAAKFESAYQCAALQALSWGDAPMAGKLIYAPAFSDL